MSGLQEIGFADVFAVFRFFQDTEDGAYAELKAQVDEQLKKYETLKNEGVKGLNEAVHKLMIPIIGN